jgi:BMFP domain-containing protein YqiC
MAKKTIDVGVVLSADNKAYKKGMTDAARASREMERAAKDSAKQAEQQFKQVTMALAKVAGAVMIAKEAFDIYAKVMNSTEGTADKFEQQMATLHGTLQGLMMTVATGSWENLISNIKNTAKATRELTTALDAYEDSKAGTSVRRGKVSFNLQEARVSAAEATDPAEKAKFLQQAIDYQKELTAIEVDEIKKRLVISEDYYKTVTGHSKEYFDYFLSMVPKLANNYDYYFGPNSVMMEGSKARLGQLDYLKQLAPLTKAQEKERHELQLLVFAMEDFILVRDSFSKPGQFNEYIKGLGELEMASAEGEKALVRLVKQLQTAKTKSEDIKRVTGPDKIYMPLNGLFPGDPDALRPDMTRDASKQLKEQFQLVNDLEGAFVDMFTSISSGSGTAFEDMAKAFSRALEQMAAQFAAKAAMFGILTLLSGGSGALAGWAKAALGAKSFGQFTGAGLSFSSPSMPSNPININVTGKISGRDIHLSNSRYMQMMTSTT